MQIIVNQKTNITLNEIKKYEKILQDYDVIIIPAIPYLGLFTQGAYHLGSQKLDLENKSGAINIESIKGIGCEYILISDYIESDTIQKIGEANQKIQKAIDNKLIPLIIIGETKEEKDLNKSIKKLEKQISYIYNEIDFKNTIPYIIYNPLYNIESNLEIIKNNIKSIKDIFYDFCGKKIKLFIGSNINEEYEQIIKDSNIDGLYLTNNTEDIHELIKIYNNVT